jgi:hypothetical protein
MKTLLDYSAESRIKECKITQEEAIRNWWDTLNP